jgi:hypothetical protein
MCTSKKLLHVHFKETIACVLKKTTARLLPRNYCMCTLKKLLHVYCKKNYCMCTSKKLLHVHFKETTACVLQKTSVRVLQINYCMCTSKKLLHAYAWTQASAAVSMRSSLFWDIAQHRLVVTYRRFGATYRSHPQGSSSPFFLDSLTLEDGTDTLPRSVVGN